MQRLYVPTYSLLTSHRFGDNRSMPWSHPTIPAPLVADERHLLALDWFQTQAGNEISWPEPLGGMFLVNKAKGIHKPAGLSHALSIRQSLCGPYEDAIKLKGNGSWSLDYEQEGLDPSSFANRALRECIKDNIPVGVLIQVKPSPSPKYKVLGLGQVTNFSNGRFTVQQYGFSSENALSIAVSSQDFDAKNADDARKKALRAIAIRRGQPAFRASLIDAYGGRCAISGCRVHAVLEAAHIMPYKGDHTNHVQNGILLRTDLHTLFDLNLLSIDSVKYTVQMSPAMLDTEYAAFVGQKLHLPAEESDWPSQEALSTRLLLG